jgi:hypothetical protein
MNCSNCGAIVEGKFCTECGTLSELNIEAQPFGQMITPPAPKGMRRGVKLLLTIGLILGILGTSSLSVVQNSAAAEFGVAAAEAEKKVTKAIGDVSSYESLVSSYRSSKTRCYINPWCSATSYSYWSRLVDAGEMLATMAKEDVAKWTSKKRGAIKAKQGAESSRNLLIGTSVVEALGLGALLVLTRRKKA